jgi:hypothetical protein
MKKHRSAIAGVMLAILAVAGLCWPRAASASDVWCWDDPVLLIDGVPIAVNLGIQQQHLDIIESIDITVEVPPGTTAGILYVERGTVTPRVRLSYPGGAPRETDPHGGVDSATVTVHVRARDSFDYLVNILNPADLAIAPQTTTASANSDHVARVQLRTP